MVNNNDQICSIAELAGAPRCTYIVLFTERNVFRGYTIHAISERFLDILNQGSIVNKPGLTNEFLPLTEVEIFDLNGKKEDVAANCLISKNNTLAVGESRITRGELPPSTPFRYTLFQRKKPVSVNIQIQDLTVVGQVYISQSEASIEALEMDQIFIPVTNATLSSNLNSSHFEFDFLAVNKNQIISISELIVSQPYLSDHF
jgi:hypothetical protein